MDYFLRKSDLPPIYIFDGNATKKHNPDEYMMSASALSRRISEEIEPEIIGIVYDSCIDLVTIWLACLSSKKIPVILQYPTGKQDRYSYISYLESAIIAAGVGHLILSEKTSTKIGALSIPTTIIVGPLPKNSEPIDFIPHGQIIQMSSGTTGQRKPMLVPTRNIVQHVKNYNKVLKLTKHDIIASWLPLYHDMGFIACFCMPMIIGSPFAMMDPMTWASNPLSFFNMISNVGGTICYMPNFGFEVMRRQKKYAPQSVRLWVSCSEPVSANTVEGFLQATGTSLSKFATCYAMAENIFAVSMVISPRALRLAGAGRSVSCGSAIPGVLFKIVNDEIWIKSDEAITSYLSGELTIDKDGYYKSGDVGVIIENELFILGRVHDIINVSGEKYMLSDIDIEAYEIFPEVKGRVATISRSGEWETEVPVLLMESKHFFRSPPEPELMKKLRDRTGLHSLQACYVPPRFISKTTSGKANRKLTAHNYLSLDKNVKIGKIDNKKEIEELLKSLNHSDIIEKSLDSLSIIMLRSLFEEEGQCFNSELKVEDALSFLSEMKSDFCHEDAHEETFNIINIGDQRSFVWLNNTVISELCRIFGRNIKFINICLPPIGVIFSNMVFCDYFMNRLNSEESEYLKNILNAHNMLRSASMIICDDSNEINLLSSFGAAYSYLSHQSERDARANFVATRIQRYAASDPYLPMGVVSGSFLLGDGCRNVNKTIDAFSEYIGIPVLKLACLPKYKDITNNWDIILDEKIIGHDNGYNNRLLATRLFYNLVEHIKQNIVKMEPKKIDFNGSIKAAEMPHYCSFMASKEYLDKVIDSFDRFIICGNPSSLPYVLNRIKEKSKSWDFIPNHQMINDKIESSYECALVIGSMGTPPVRMPYFSVLGMLPDAPMLGNLPEHIAEQFFNKSVHMTLEDYRGVSEGFYQPF